jgi:mRNA-degrading endonuclease RelE of RelBE toxin-antitoxin system
MRWSLHYSPGAVDSLYHKVERQFARQVNEVIRALAEDPTPPTMQVDEEDPSVYRVPAPGDHTVFYEILDEHPIVQIIQCAQSAR